MGWTYYPKPQGDPAVYLPARFVRDPEDLKAAARVRDDLYDAVYMAVKLAGSDRVIAFIVLIDEGPKEIGYKAMSETEGPNACSAPADVLMALTEPAPNEWAAEWRHNCTVNHHKAATL